MLALRGYCWRLVAHCGMRLNLLFLLELSYHFEIFIFMLLPFNTLFCYLNPRFILNVPEKAW